MSFEEFAQIYFIYVYNLCIIDDSYELTKGEYQFPFAFTLPENIPSTFQAETHSKFDYGHVSYTIKAVLERFSRRRSTCENQCHNPLAVWCMKTHTKLYFLDYITIQLLHSECSKNAKIKLRMFCHSDGEKSCRSQHYSSCIGIWLFCIAECDSGMSHIFLDICRFRWSLWNPRSASAFAVSPLDRLR